MPDPTTRRVLALAALLLWGCLSVTGFAIHPSELRPGDVARTPMPFFLPARGAGIDYYQFWIVGRARERIRLDDIYSGPDRGRMAAQGREILAASSPPSYRLGGCVEFRSRAIETFSTPFLYAVVNAIAGGDFDRDYDRFTNVCLAACMFSLLAMCWMLGYSLIESVLFAAVVLFWCEPLASDLRVGNVNQIQLAGVALYLLSRRRPEREWMDLLGGLVLGLLVAFKPTLGLVPALLALSWSIDRRWSTLFRHGSAAVSAAAAFLAGALFLGSWSAWRCWVNALPGLDTVSDLSVQAGNLALAQIVFESPGGHSHAAPVLLLLVLVGAGLTLWLTRPRTPEAAADRELWPERDFAVTALACASSVVALRLSWLHYYLLLLPLLLFVLRPGGWTRYEVTGRSGSPAPLVATVLGSLAVAAIFMRPLAVLFEPGPSLAVAVSVGGAWGLLLLGLASLWFPRHPDELRRTPS